MRVRLPKSKKQKHYDGSEIKLADCISKVVISLNANNTVVKALEDFKVRPSLVQHKEW